MLVQQASIGQRESQRLALQFAGTEDEVLEALRLRYRVFGEEMGARLKSAHPGIDRDLFDAYCEHLLVRDVETNEVVGTYRILRPEQAQRLGGYYSEDEFDMVRLGHLRERIVEIGRSCVHPDYRSGATIALLWSGLGDYMRRHGYGYLIGCASMSMGDGGHVAASTYRRLVESYMCPVEYRVQPRCPLPIEALNSGLKVTVPPLIKGYLRCGAWVCGAPAWDPDFNTADLFLLMPMARVRERYVRHFLREAV
ncbi:MAG: GNAT family N-acetyltransferase [Pseudomonadota bacterium]